MHSDGRIHPKMPPRGKPRWAARRRPLAPRSPYSMRSLNFPFCRPFPNDPLCNFGTSRPRSSRRGGLWQNCQGMSRGVHELEGTGHSAICLYPEEPWALGRVWPEAGSKCRLSNEKVGRTWRLFTTWIQTRTHE